MAEIWSTTFYYEQQLRSVYMNNLINGLVSPGLYNVDAAIFVVPNGVSGKEAGLWLKLKAGAVFVYSNAYDSVGGKLSRNLEKTGSYVVKCVLQEDTEFLLAVPTGKASKFLNGGRKAPTIFVYSYFHYSEDSEGDSLPKFALAVPSSNTDAMFAGTSDSYLPNEGLVVTAGTNTNVSYLILGALLDNGQESLPLAYSNSASGWEPGGHTAWITNHIFTGRAFPDHKGGMFQEVQSPMPSIAFAEQYKHMYLTKGQFYFGSTVYNIPGVDWKVLYGQSGTASATLPTKYTGHITDGYFADKDTVTYSIAPPPLAGNAGKLVIDIGFIALNTELASSEYEGLPSLLNVLDPSKLVKKPIIPFNFVATDYSGIDWDVSSMRSEYGLNYETIPLDTAISNQKRLRALLYDRNIILPIVNHIRQQARTASPFLDAKVGESLLPLFLSVRKVNSTATDFVDKGSSVATAACNPANIISFFELQASSFAITSAALVAEETYPTLPFLD